MRPDGAVKGLPIRVVDLFAGCGGMSLGLQEAARRVQRLLKVALAVDLDDDVMKVYEANHVGARIRVADVASLFDGEVGKSRTKVERSIRQTVGRIDVLLGGPPCQGHSDLNNRTRRRDPRNALYLLMARAAEVLTPKVVVVENVVPVQHDEDGVLEKTTNALTTAGYETAGRIVDLRRVGVPQRRRRFLLIASKVPGIKPVSLLEELATDLSSHPDRSVRWAMYDLLEIRSEKAYDRASRASSTNAARMAYLFEKDLYDLPNDQRPKCHRDGDHSYVSMYGRLRWDEPAQTITTGFGSMGQGRYVHPERPRTITAHEAARLQTFPDWFDFGKDTSPGILAKTIGNAVPPLLMVEIGARIIPKLDSTTSTR